MDPYLLFNVLCVLIGSLPFVAIVLWFKRRQAMAYSEALSAVAGAEILLEEPSALWVSVEPDDQKIKGNGILLLTPEELYFLKLLPKLEVRIKRQRILRLERPEMTAGRGRNNRLISVVFETDHGHEGRHSWLVQNHAAWVNALNTQSQKGG